MTRRFCNKAVLRLNKAIGANIHTIEMTRGCVKKAVLMSPDRNAKIARVLPQVKQGMPVYRRNGQSMIPKSWHTKMHPPMIQSEPSARKKVRGRGS
jgi:hypothetical protein